MTPFGLKVRELRLKKGITQKALAAALGVSPAYLSALERGRRGRPNQPDPIASRSASANWRFKKGLFSNTWPAPKKPLRLAASAG